MYKILIAIIIVALLAGAGLFLFKKDHTVLQPISSRGTQISPTPVLDKQQTTLPTKTQEAQNNIVYTSNGFSPASLTVKKGATVTWTNSSGSDLSLNSDPHPTHTNYPPLNIGVIENGQSKSLTFDKPGTYGYHNHFNASDKGMIIVQ